MFIKFEEPRIFSGAVTLSIFFVNHTLPDPIMGDSRKHVSSGWRKQMDIRNCFLAFGQLVECVLDRWTSLWPSPWGDSFMVLHDGKKYGLKKRHCNIKARRHGYSLKGPPHEITGLSQSGSSAWIFCIRFNGHQQQRSNWDCLSRASFQVEGDWSDEGIGVDYSATWTPSGNLGCKEFWWSWYLWRDLAPQSRPEYLFSQLRLVSLPASCFPSGWRGCWLIWLASEFPRYQKTWCESMNFKHAHTQFVPLPELTGMSSLLA